MGGAGAILSLMFLTLALQQVIGRQDQDQDQDGSDIKTQRGHGASIRSDMYIKVSDSELKSEIDVRQFFPNLKLFHDFQWESVGLASQLIKLVMKLGFNWSQKFKLVVRPVASCKTRWFGESFESYFPHFLLKNSRYSLKELSR